MTRERVLTAYRSALQAVDPEAAVARAVRDLESERVWVAAVGKAAPAMVRGAASALGEAMRGFLAVSDHVEPTAANGSVFVGGHPFPDERSERAGRALLSFVGSIPPDDLLLVLVSGGGSALVEVPVEGVAVEDVARLTDRLMHVGTPIEEINLVRRHLSRIKNGGLLRATTATRAVTLVVSDVIDAGPEVVASGPTLVDGSSVDDAVEVIRSRLGVDFPVRPVGPTGPLPEHRAEVVADCSMAALAAADELGAEVWTAALRGEASEQARRMVAAGEKRPLVATGETTVTVRGAGLGGRNQEAALAAAIALDGETGWFGALGTDGIDGPTEAAGAIVDGNSADRMRRLGVDPYRALESNDSHGALAAARRSRRHRALRHQRRRSVDQPSLRTIRAQAWTDRRR